MKKAQYLYLINLFSKTTRRKKISIIICNITPIIIMISYGLLIIYEFIQYTSNFLCIILVPLITFIIITLIRKTLNKPRPFEVFDYEPLISHSNGQSFPSRHTASALIIAYTFLYLNHPFTPIIFFLVFIVAVTRIISGVHRPTDVLSAIIITSLCAYIGFYLL